VVVAIGGGSVLDMAKAVAGLLIPGNSVRDHLEGVGPELPYRGPSVPFVAVPTTAGTGSEATKNAVLSERGPQGFKKSFRDDSLVAQVAIVDPDLLAGCPPDVIAGNGMDALTQLLESYLSVRANPFTDALALSGLAAARDGLLTWHAEAVAGRGGGGPGTPGGRGSGADGLRRIVLGDLSRSRRARAVHGLGVAARALFPIPHGAACGATLTAATRSTSRLWRRAILRAWRSPVTRWRRGCSRVARPGRVRDALRSGPGTGIVERPPGRSGLSSFGITASDIPSIVADSRGSSMKTNPVTLTDDEIAAILEASL